MMPVSARWKLFWSLLAILSFVALMHRAWVLPVSDTEAYFNAGVRALHGLSLYPNDPTPYKYLPVTSYLFVPLALSNGHWAKVWVFLASWLSAAVFYRIIVRRHGHRVAALTLACLLRFHNHDFLNLQINHLILLFFIGFLYLRKRQPWASALCFALAASFKVTPFILLAALAWFRSWKELGRIIAWCLALFLLPALTFKAGFGIYREWYDLVKATTPYPAPEFPIIQSVQAGLWYYLGDWLSAGGFFVLVNALFAAMIAATLAYGSGQLAALCALGVLSVVFSPLAWKHHYILIAPAVVWVLAERRYRVYVVSLILLALAPALIAPLSKHIADRSYLTVFGALVLWGGCLGRRATV